MSRVGFDKLKSKGREAALFALRYENGAGPKVLQADAVIDVSGTWFTPNPGGANGVAAIGGERTLSPHSLRHAGRARQGSCAL